MSVSVENVETALKTLLSAKVTSTSDIGEVSYQGQSFAYPCLRFEVESCERRECPTYFVNFTVFGWSESMSSLEVTRLIDEVITGIVGKVQATPTRLQAVSLLSARKAVREGKRLWRREAYFTCLAS